MLRNSITSEIKGNSPVACICCSNDLVPPCIPYSWNPCVRIQVFHRRVWKRAWSLYGEKMLSDKRRTLICLKLNIEIRFLSANFCFNRYSFMAHDKYTKN
ncbi:hypothetical protein PHAVU_005G104950 [Phaseolus vulgaris]